MAMTSDVRVRAFPGLSPDEIEILTSGELASAVPHWQGILNAAWHDSAFTGDARLECAWAAVFRAFDAQGGRS